MGVPLVVFFFFYGRLTVAVVFLSASSIREDTPRCVLEVGYSEMREVSLYIVQYTPYVLYLRARAREEGGGARYTH